MPDSIRDYDYREVSYSHARHQLQFAIGYGLFSTGGIDQGTILLLRSLAGKNLGAVDGAPPRAILDMGCGYGPLAVCLAAEHPQARVVGVDRDLLAVRYTELNARANGTPNVTALPSIGYTALRDGRPDLPETYDLIVANLPAKAGDSGLHVLLLGAGKRLAPGGRLAVVIVTPMAKIVAPFIEQASEVVPVVVEHEDSRSEHTIWHLRFPEGLPDLEPVKDRNEAAIGVDPISPFRRDDVPRTFDDVPFVAVHNVPEFDTLDHRTKLILAVLKQVHRAPEGGGERILCANPRHGLLARKLLAERHPKDVVLLDRDWLALTAAERNLNAARIAHAHTHPDAPPCAIESRLAIGLGVQDALTPSDGHLPTADESAAQTPLTGPFDLIVGAVRDEEWRPGLNRFLREARALLAPEGVIVLGLRAAEIQTLLKPAASGVHFKLGRTLKRKGFAGQLLR